MVGLTGGAAATAVVADGCRGLVDGGLAAGGCDARFLREPSAVTALDSAASVFSSEPSFASTASIRVSTVASTAYMEDNTQQTFTQTRAYKLKRALLESTAHGVQ